ncbi:MAG: thiol:disulfide interchange protein DsbA/DsbL [Pseudomonadota bacterium]
MKKAHYWLAAIGLSLAAATAARAEAEFQEGIHYERLATPVPTGTGKQVEVLEMFWYGCPHCYRFEPFVERFLENKPKTAEFVRVPAIFRPEWEVHARAYYTAELLGVVDKIHRPLFEAIHEQHARLDDHAAIQKFFVEHGVKQTDFAKTFNSFAVETKVRRSKKAAEIYGVTGVPAVIINGKYRTSVSTAGSGEAVLKIIDFLVKQESGKKK